MPKKEVNRKENAVGNIAMVTDLKGYSYSVNNLLSEKECWKQFLHSFKKGLTKKKTPWERLLRGD